MVRTKQNDELVHGITICCVSDGENISRAVTEVV